MDFIIIKIFCSQKNIIKRKEKSYILGEGINKGISVNQTVLLRMAQPSKIIQARLPQYVTQEHPDVQAGFRKGRGTIDQIANIHWS